MIYSYPASSPNYYKAGYSGQTTADNFQGNNVYHRGYAFHVKEDGSENDYQGTFYVQGTTLTYSGWGHIDGEYKTISFEKEIGSKIP